jgi:hypothetical protein
MAITDVTVRLISHLQFPQSWLGYLHCPTTGADSDADIRQSAQASSCLSTFGRNFRGRIFFWREEYLVSSEGASHSSELLSHF